MSPTLLRSKIISARRPSFLSAHKPIPALTRVRKIWAFLQNLPLGFGKQAEATQGGQSPGIQACGMSWFSFCLESPCARNEATWQVLGGQTPTEEKTVCPLGLPLPLCLANLHLPPRLSSAIPPLKPSHLFCDLLASLGQGRGPKGVLCPPF